MSWLVRSLTYCRQMVLRSQGSVQLLKQGLVPSTGPKVLNSNPEGVVPLTGIIRAMSSLVPPYKFDTPSPYKKPGPNRHGYQQKYFDGGRLPRGSDKPLKSRPQYRPTNIWSRKRALFGQNDYIDILGDSPLRPVDLINGPRWLRGFNGNELQRLARRLAFEGNKIQQLYPTEHSNMLKRMKFLYKKYNKKRGRRHT